MKALVIILSILLQTYWVNSQYPSFDSVLLKCIPIVHPDTNIIHNYNKLQVITNLVRVPLRDIARFQVVPEENAFYNQFIFCSWKKYQFQTKQGIVIFDAIERVLKDAIIREVEGTGPGINLSKLEAKKIVNNCKHIQGHTGGHIAVQVQNCILKQIQHFATV